MHEVLRFNYFFEEKIFIDSKLNENFWHLYVKGNEISEIIINNTESNGFKLKYVLDDEEQNLFNATITGNIDRLEEKIKEYFEYYEELKEIIQKHKISYDISFW